MERVRATKLQEILDTTVSATLRACSYDKLASCFPTLAQNDAPSLEHAQQQVYDFLQTTMAQEFGKILAEREAVQRLDELDLLIKQARERKERGEARTEHMDLPPEVILQAHLIPVKRRELEGMRLALDQLQAENGQALAAMETTRVQLEQEAANLQALLQTPQP
ncbi:Nnf1-domain-containing protein [Protomyces lactucae-debilis]|uniref:Nnf1-domain-containing protein n=1 Tax=Protomyces lactucae-debilis TaxID=2754530 RepID=A0A1Y2EUQ9_PROLT|nr:Nnf1-domain-containing protein [Protomyces lactucae-debilis]ORY74585.1 Nnf1-domain-containing protein [Protomyces lactucae-debilis]